MNKNYRLLFEHVPQEEGYYVVGIDSDARELLEVEVPETYLGKPVVGVGANAFEWNERVVSVVLPPSVRKIRSNAFAYCFNLRNVVLPAALDVLEVGVFLRCSKLADIRLPRNLKEIRQLALFGTGLSEIALHNAAVKIFPEALPSSATLRAFPGSFGEIYARRCGLRFRPLRRPYFKARNK